MDFWNEFFKSGTIIECQEHYVIGAGKRSWIKQQQPEAYNFYFPDFFLRHTRPFFLHEEVITLEKNRFADVLKEPRSPLFYDWTAPDLKSYEWQFRRLYDLLEAGFLKKAVLYAKKETPLNQELKVASLLQSALKNKGHAHLYGFWDQSEGMIGAAPEILFEKNDEGIFLEAVAGTKLGTPFTTKEDLEHQLVIDGIQEALLPYGTVRSFPRRTLAFGNLTHLLTPLKLETKNQVSFLDLVKSLHPTPALGTFPKDQGLPWLKEVDALLPRLRYGAPVGFSHTQKERCLVAIRNIQWQNHVGCIMAGGGVTKDSIMENEWEEILRKFNAIKKILNI